MSVTAILRRQKQEDLELEVNLGYIVRPCLKNQPYKKKESKHQLLFMSSHTSWSSPPE
jgi:hypothetical protein